MAEKKPVKTTTRIKLRGYKLIDSNENMEIYESKEQRVVLHLMTVNKKKDCYIFSESLTPFEDEFGMRHYERVALSSGEAMLFGARAFEMKQEALKKKDA